MSDSSVTLPGNAEIQGSDRIYEFNSGGWVFARKASVLLPAQLRLQTLRMEYLRWVERDDIIIFLLNTGSAEAKVTFMLKNSFENEKNQNTHIHLAL